jgi:ABC-type phosphate/phosphonate transport system substrate-binding protein
MTRLLSTTAALAMLGLVGAFSPSSAADKSWDAMPHRKCSEMITPSGEFTAKTEAMLTWLVGYIDGISAPSILDKRLKTISDAGSEQIGPLVLVFCSSKQDDTLIEATTGVAEFLINSQSGRVLNLQFR